MQDIFQDKQLMIMLAILVFCFVSTTWLILRGMQKRKKRASAIADARKEAVHLGVHPVTQEEKIEIKPKPDTTTKQPTEVERVTKGLSRTTAFFQQAIDRLLAGSEGETFYEDIEEALLTADVGVMFAESVVTDLKKKWGLKIPVRAELKSSLSEILISLLPSGTQEGVYNGPKQDRPVATNYQHSLGAQSPHVIMVVGVNGAGKTTTIAKLCSRFQNEGQKVMVGAADTFRAAASEQLKIWVERVGAQGVFQSQGSDPSAVAFDAVQSAVAKNSDVCIVDTAGRLHTKTNLMEELKKMKRVIQKAMPSAPHDVWLVVDGTIGQNALNQAREFHQALGLTGIIVTKLDGSAKGGVVLSISSELKIPVVYIGIGESPEDLIPFNAPSFIGAMLKGVG